MGVCTTKLDDHIVYWRNALRRTAGLYQSRKMESHGCESRDIPFRPSIGARHACADFSYCADQSPLDSFGYTVRKQFKGNVIQNVVKKPE